MNIGQRKISVIGAGSVGSQVAFSLVLSNLASDLVLVDVNKDKAKGEALDLAHGMPLSSSLHISHGDFSLIEDSSIVIYTAGVGRKPGESRLDLVNKNLSILKSSLPQIEKFAPNCIFIVIANPVDILTYATLKLSSFPKNRVIGSGTVLDSSRFRYYLSQYFKVNPKNIEAHIIGEHGQSAVPLWSSATINGFPIEEFAKYFNITFDENVKNKILSDTKNSAGEVIRCKRATNFAIALSVREIVKSILNNENSLLPVSTYIEGLFKINDVCLSLPTIINNQGVNSVFKVPLTSDELKGLQESSESLLSIIKSIDI